MTITIYGIKNCDTMKKARSWLKPMASTILSMTIKRPALTAPISKHGVMPQAGKRFLIGRARPSRN